MTDHSGNHVCDGCLPPHQHAPDDQGLCPCGVDCSPGPHVTPARSPESLADEALGANLRALVDQEDVGEVTIACGIGACGVRVMRFAARDGLPDKTTGLNRRTLDAAVEAARKEAR